MHNRSFCYRNWLFDLIGNELAASIDKCQIDERLLEGYDIFSNHIVHPIDFDTKKESFGCELEAKANRIFGSQALQVGLSVVMLSTAAIFYDIKRRYPNLQINLVPRYTVAEMIDIHSRSSGAVIGEFDVFPVGIHSHWRLQEKAKHYKLKIPLPKVEASVYVPKSWELSNERVISQKLKDRGIGILGVTDPERDSVVATLRQCMPDIFPIDVRLKGIAPTVLVDNLVKADQPLLLFGSARLVGEKYGQKLDDLPGLGSLCFLAVHEDWAKNGEPHDFRLQVLAEMIYRSWRLLRDEHKERSETIRFMLSDDAMCQMIANQINMDMPSIRATNESPGMGQKVAFPNLSAEPKREGTDVQAGPLRNASDFHELYQVMLAARAKLGAINAEWWQKHCFKPQPTTSDRSFVVIDPKAEASCHRRKLAREYRDNLRIQALRLWHAGLPQPPTQIDDGERDIIEQLTPWMMNALSLESTGHPLPGPVQATAGGIMENAKPSDPPVQSDLEVIRAFIGALDAYAAVDAAHRHFSQRYCPSLPGMAGVIRDIEPEAFFAQNRLYHQQGDAHWAAVAKRLPEIMKLSVRYGVAGGVFFVLARHKPADIAHARAAALQLADAYAAAQKPVGNGCSRPAESEPKADAAASAGGGPAPDGAGRPLHTARGRPTTTKVPSPPNESTAYRFTVALSFPGEKRDFVKSVAAALAKRLGEERVLFDEYLTAELARPNLDTYLCGLYHDHSELLVPFFCADYDKKEWCGLEWRQMRDLLKRKRDNQIMLLRFDDAPIKGVLSIDGYVKIGSRTSEQVADLILERLRQLHGATNA